MKDFKKSVILSVEEFEQIEKEISELKKLIRSDTTIMVESERNRIVNLYANRYMMMRDISESEYKFGFSNEDEEIYKAIETLKKYKYFEFGCRADKENKIW